MCQSNHTHIVHNESHHMRSHDENHNERHDENHHEGSHDENHLASHHGDSHDENHHTNDHADPNDEIRVADPGYVSINLPALFENFQKFLTGRYKLAFKEISLIPGRTDGKGHLISKLHKHGTIKNADESQIEIQDVVFPGLSYIIYADPQQINNYEVISNLGQGTEVIIETDPWDTILSVEEYQES